MQLHLHKWFINKQSFNKLWIFFNSSALKYSLTISVKQVNQWITTHQIVVSKSHNHKWLKHRRELFHIVSLILKVSPVTPLSLVDRCVSRESWMFHQLTAEISRRWEGKFPRPCPLSWWMFYWRGIAQLERAVSKSIFNENYQKHSLFTFSCFITLFAQQIGIWSKHIDSFISQQWVAGLFLHNFWRHYSW